MSNRLQQVASHVLPSSYTANKAGYKSPEDVVIVSALRTAITRARKGPFQSTLPEEMLAPVFKAIIQKTGIDPKLVEDITVGNVLPQGGGATNARMAALYAGFPETTAVSTLNRQSGILEIGIGAGVESMTLNYGASSLAPTSERIADNCESAADCLIPMGITSENVAADFQVSREKQDAFAAESHRKADIAQKNGWFQEEIVPVEAIVTDEEGNEKVVLADRDDGIRPGTTAEKLSKLRPAFDDDGTTTAGNASQVSDGAAAVLLMKRKTAQKLKLANLGQIHYLCCCWCSSRIMGVGPAYAIPVALQRAGLTVDQVDIFEINEAFASQALGIPAEKVNPKGGAIAFGHPLGCTGARQIATLLPELKRQGKKIGVTSMCIGSGMGMSAVFESE
ncbi:Thiolase, N-terminal domain-containing protein [Mucor lusitanicus]